MSRSVEYNKKRRTLANELRNKGVGLPILAPEKSVKINPVGFYSPDRTKYNLIWTNYDLNQCISRYIWENLPNGLTSWNLERMLYFRGTLCGFKFGGKGYILPYTPSAEINPYGFPSEVEPLTYNGRAVAGKNDFFAKNFKLPVDATGDEVDDYSAVLLYDSIPYSASGHSPSRFFLNQIIINDLADTLARVNINIVVSNKKILLVIKDPKQADVVRRELEIAFNSDSPFGILTSELDVDNVQYSNDFQADDLFNVIKNYDAIRCFMNGISSKGFGSEKKERISTGELAGGEEEKDLILDMGYDLRKLFCDQVNKKFGWNISVRKRADDYDNKMKEYSTEVNGKGLNALEETQGVDNGK